MEGEPHVGNVRFLGNRCPIGVLGLLKGKRVSYNKTHVHAFSPTRLCLL